MGLRGGYSSADGHRQELVGRQRLADVARSSTEVLRYDGSSLLKDNTRTPTSLVVRSARRSVGAGLGRRLRRHRARAAVGRGLLWRRRRPGRARPGDPGRPVPRWTAGRPPSGASAGSPSAAPTSHEGTDSPPRSRTPACASPSSHGVLAPTALVRAEQSAWDAASVTGAELDGAAELTRRPARSRTPTRTAYCSTSLRSSPSGAPPPAGLRRQLGSRSGGVAAPGQPRWRSSSPARPGRRRRSRVVMSEISLRDQGSSRCARPGLPADSSRTSSARSSATRNTRLARSAASISVTTSAACCGVDTSRRMASDRMITFAEVEALTAWNHASG